MIEAPEKEIAHALTDGDIAVINLESARTGMWSRFWRDPRRPGIAELIVEQEQLTLQFLGDTGALNRVDALLTHLSQMEADSPRIALLQAQFASMTHRFADARSFLANASSCIESSDRAARLSLSIDQACGTNLDRVLSARLRMARESGRLEDLLPLGGLYADLREFNEADQIYQRALSEYRETSPFAVAWVCFQLGALWGELVPASQPDKAKMWYQRAIRYLPSYVKARVHLAEIYLEQERLEEAEALLIPALASGDPEVNWRLADVLHAMGRLDHAELQLQAARIGFEALLGKHLLAFADHGAEFYSGSGNNAGRAFELASINLANRPTLRAFEQAYKTAQAAGANDAASSILAGSARCWHVITDLKVSRLSILHGEAIHPEKSIQGAIS